MSRAPVSARFKAMEETFLGVRHSDAEPLKPDPLLQTRRPGDPDPRDFFWFFFTCVVPGGLTESGPERLAEGPLLLFLSSLSRGAA